MQHIYHKHPIHVLRLDPDEELHATLSRFLDDHGISSGVFSGIGSAQEVTLAYYRLEHKEYESHTLAQNLEVTSMHGNIAYHKNERVIHAHGVVGDDALHAYTGHIDALIVSATLEVTLTVLEDRLEREQDGHVGLPLLSS